MLKSAIKKQLIKKPLLYEWALRILQKSEAQEVMVLRKIVRSSDTVFDIGANVGQFTCLLAHLAGSKGAVHAFEPIPPVFHKLQNNIHHNGLSSTVFLNQCALSDKKGFVQMYVPACDFTQASTFKHTTASWDQTISDVKIDTYEAIRATTIDDYVSERCLGDISFIKCDVEGAELLVLKGAASVLRRKSPPVLLLEVCKDWTRDVGYEPKDLFEFLISVSGYEFIYLGENGLETVTLDCEHIPGVFPGYLNFLCYVPDVHNDRISTLMDRVSK